MQTKSQIPFVKIAILENAIEAQLISSILEERDIPHRLRSYHDTAYDGLFQVQKGWGKLDGPQAHKQEILQIIRELRSNQFFRDNDNVE